jgi:ribosomal-protein-alanine N-acetyltransferase
MNEINFPVLETDRLVLRKIESTDREALYKIFSSDKIMEHYGMFPYKDMSEVDILISNFSKAFEEQKSIRWAIELKEKRIVIGTCGFHNWNKKHLRAEVGYELNENYWRKGYIFEAITKLLEYAFYDLNINRVEALVYPENVASHLSLEKLGFQKEGLLKEYCIFRDKKQDLIMYSLLKS